MSNLDNNLKGLQPQTVWAHFSTLCEIPRASLQEAALISHLINWAKMRGLDAEVDEVGNLILRKPASPGYEDSTAVVIQGHLDMVCQANSGVVHDFLRDPIDAVVKNGWVVSEDTTLGADNGIGVALALSALEAPDLIHPPIEVLLTVNEECGMDGARGLAPGLLKGKRLINLDAEEWGHFYLGCAGGVDAHVANKCEQQDVPSGYALVRFDVSGLCGGHSGLDIYLGRGNGIKLLAEALRDLSFHSDVCLIEMKGGTARNAIPREAYALCALPNEIAFNIDEWVMHRSKTWKQRFAKTDAGVNFSCSHYDKQATATIKSKDRDRLLGFLDTAANGVYLKSEDYPEVTDTSSNIGVVTLEDGRFKAIFKVRSLHDERAAALADKLLVHADGFGLHAWKEGQYPGWTPNPASPMLAMCERVYAREFGKPAGLQVIHAGLECGLLAASHPHLDMISFGPDIRGAHAPGERVEIESVKRCWILLKALLQELAQTRH